MNSSARSPLSKTPLLTKARGAALVTGLVFLSIMTMLGVTSVTVALLQEKMVSNAKVNIDARLNATTGISNHLSAHQDLTDTASYYASIGAANQLASTSHRFYRGTSANAISLFGYSSGNANHSLTTTTDSYTSRARFADISYAQDAAVFSDITDNGSHDVIYYGYGSGSTEDSKTTPKAFLAQAATSASTSPFYRPIVVFDAFGTASPDTAVVTRYAVHEPGPPILATIYGKEASGSASADIEVGASGVIDSSQDTTCGAGLFDGLTSNPSVYFLDVNDGATPAYEMNSTGTIQGSTDPTSTLQTGEINIDVSQFISRYSAGETDRTGGDIEIDYAGNDHSDTDDYRVFYDSAGRTVDEASGIHYGLLIVNGNLVLNDNFNGLIIANGTVQVDSGNTVSGAIIANETVTIKGTVQFSGCEIVKALSTQPLITIRQSNATEPGDIDP